jgi:hypothetical protein
MASHDSRAVDELEELTGVPLRGAADYPTPSNDGTVSGSDKVGPTPQKRKSPPTAGSVGYDRSQSCTSATNSR